ncbi:P-type conjugative transfer protein TrbL [Govanella unica]|uniref:P-type conjugative transfer protein TrbL n=1 Tax=Govanella unica TaxID=2975056 RepID=A0A9X3Z751_9PROT|nr:P-type conjugative transfer protein TrbL [Govania unica]MDA5193713.1 P-type conjugative transfer protein TrbL [Govania unica]
MDDLNVIDQFTATFVTYIDSGFGLLEPDVAFLTTILIGIDITLAGLAWAMTEDKSVIPALIRKVLYVGTFALILNNFSTLAGIVFKSFAQLGLTATEAALTAGDLMRPGFVAAAGYDAATPLLEEVSELIGPVAFFENFVTIMILMFAWIVVLLAFFILAIQLFMTILEFKLTTLAGFVLIPFALWNKTSFLAERVLGNVISAGIKLMVLAVIVGIGSTLFGTFAASFSGEEVTLREASATVLGALSIFMLGIFGPGVAAGLVSGAPQLGAGAAVGSVAGLALGGAAAGAVAAGGLRAAGAGLSRATQAAAATAGGRASPHNSGQGMSGSAAASSVTRPGSPGEKSGSTAATGGGSAAPAWAAKLNRGQKFRDLANITAHTIRDGDRPMSGESPKLTQEDR